MILDEILNLLEAEGVGTSASTLFWGYMPDMPDRIITVFEYAGEPDQETKTGLVRQLPRLQVITRSDDYADAMSLAIQANQALTSVSDQELGDSYYHRIRALQRPFGDPSGSDGRGRSRVICNYRLERVPGGP